MTQPKPVTAMDHYARGVEALNNGQWEVAEIHALLGNLRLNIDRARWEGKMT